MPIVSDPIDKNLPAPLDYRRPVSDLRVDAPNPDFHSKWLFGALLPIGIATYGVICIIRRVAEWGGNHSRLTVHGLNAVAVGMVFITAAAFVHCRAFWGEVVQTHWIVELSEILAAILFIVALGTLIVRAGIYGIA